MNEETQERDACQDTGGHRLFTSVWYHRFRVKGQIFKALRLQCAELGDSKCHTAHHRYQKFDSALL